ncbi:MAG: tetratricopeptide repeat protein, partial [Planctomycetota bacterium]
MATFQAGAMPMPFDEADPLARSMNTAHGLLNRGLYAEAAAEYRLAIDGFDESGERVRQLEALYGYGIALARSGEIDDAIDALEEVSRSNSTAFRADATSLLADLLRSTGRFDEAADAAEDFLVRFDDHAARSAVVAIAVECRQRTGQNQRAISLFEEYRGQLRLSPAHHERATLFAGMASADHEPDRAIDLFRRLVNDTSDPVVREQARWRLGTTLLTAERASDAVHTLRDAVEHSSEATREHASFSLGSALRVSGDPADAVVVLRDLREQATNFQPGEVGFELGIAELQAGEAHAATQTLGHAIDKLQGEAATVAR